MHNGHAGKAATQQPTMRALQSGPVQLACADNKALLYDEKQSASARQVGPRENPTLKHGHHTKNGLIAFYHCIHLCSLIVVILSFARL